FSGALEIDLLNLIDVSELISEADVPVGQYTKVRLGIANPRLVLLSDPDTIITDIQLTANNRLFVSRNFELVNGRDNLIRLDLGGIALRERGNGGYVLTPQLDVNIATGDQDVTLAGSVT